MGVGCSREAAKDSNGLEATEARPSEGESPLAHYSLLTIHCLRFTTHCSRFTIHHQALSPLPLTIHSPSTHCWVTTHSPLGVR